MKNIKTIATIPIERSKMVPIDIDENQQILAAALADVSMALNSSLHLDEVLDRILENLSKVVAYKTANIMLIDGKKVRIVRSRGYELLGTEKMMMSKIFDVNEITNFNKMITTKQPILSYYPHLEQDWQVLAESEWIKSHIASPIISEDKVIGFLNCDSDIAGFFNKLQSTAMQIFACEAGLAIRNARLFDASTRLSKKLRLINDLTQQVLRATSLDQIFEMLPEKLIELSEGTNVYISRWDEPSKTVSGWAATGKKNSDFLVGTSNSGDRTITEEVLNSRQPAVIENVSDTAVMDNKFQGFYQEKTLFCLPLIAEEIRLGAIIIGYANPDQITEDIRSLGEYAATQISTAIAKIHSLESERNQSSQLAHANALIESLSHVSTAIKSGGDIKNIMTTMGTELEVLRIHSMVALRSVSSEDLTLSYTSVQSNISLFA